MQTIELGINSTKVPNTSWFFFLSVRKHKEVREMCSVCKPQASYTIIFSFLTIKRFNAKQKNANFHVRWETIHIYVWNVCRPSSMVMVEGNSSCSTSLRSEVLPLCFSLRYLYFAGDNSSLHKNPVIVSSPQWCSPQNISGASQQNSVAAFCWATEGAGEKSPEASRAQIDLKMFGVWFSISIEDLLPFCHKSDFSFKILFILVWSIHTRLKEILCVDLRVSPSLDHHRNNLLSLRIQFLLFLPDLLSKVSKNSVLWRSSSQPSPLYITFTWTNSHIRFTPMCVHH